jgi:ketosteroid isomerase-like protein
MSTATFMTHTDLDTSAVLSIIEGLANAHHDKDAVAFAAAYIPDAAIFNLAPPLIHHGVDLAEKQAWLDGWDGPVEITPKDFQVRVSGDAAFCHGYMRMAGKKIGADHAISFWMRETLCLERRGGRWQIAHEHSSVPFYMDDSVRPAFDLQP